VPSLRARKGEIGSPIVSLILAVAGIAIAVIVIGYMMGAVGGMRKPMIEEGSAFLYYVETNDTWILEFNLDNPTGKTVNITEIRIKDDTGALVKADDYTPEEVAGKTKTKIIAKFTKAQLGKADTYTFIVDTTAGTIQGTAHVT